MCLFIQEHMMFGVNVGPTLGLHVGPTFGQPVGPAEIQHKYAHLRSYTLGQRVLANNGPTYNEYMLAQRWANTVALHRANMLAHLKADEQNNVRPTPFYQQWANVHLLPWANVGPKLI